jgi:hypothetical protein
LPLCSVVGTGSDDDELPDDIADILEAANNIADDDELLLLQTHLNALVQRRIGSDSESEDQVNPENESEGEAGDQEGSDGDDDAGDDGGGNDSNGDGGNENNDDDDDDDDDGGAAAAAALAIALVPAHPPPGQPYIPPAGANIQLHAPVVTHHLHCPPLSAFGPVTPLVGQCECIAGFGLPECGASANTGVFVHILDDDRQAAGQA